MSSKGSFARCVEKVSRKGGTVDPRAVCAAAKIKAGEKVNRKNPAEAAAEAFELFHGYPSEEEIVFDSKEHEHEYYAGIGDLIELVIVPDGQRKGVLLKSFRGAQLAMNENSLLKQEPLTQLFIVGGDQYLDLPTLELFGIDTSKLHEQEVLGKCVDITYFTRKTHLGKEGGVADYVHAFGEEAGKRKLRILESPTATYHTVNQIIGLWGGKYSIEPEGITN